MNRIAIFASHRSCDTTVRQEDIAKCIPAGMNICLFKPIPDHMNKMICQDCDVRTSLPSFDRWQVITGQFNKLLQHATMVFADEVIFAGDARSANRLKGLITEDTIQIQPKHFDTITVDNHTRDWTR